MRIVPKGAPSPAATRRVSPVPGGIVAVLVDDNPDDRLLVARLLRRTVNVAGIREVTSPADLAAVLADGAFDLVITDYDLRWSNGLAVLQAVRTRGDYPVIMFTGTGTEEIAVDAMRAGLDDYIVKRPERFNRLEAAVVQALTRADDRSKARAVEDRLQRLFAGVPVGLYRATLDGVILEINAGLAAILGVDVTDGFGRTLEEFITDPDSAAVRRDLLATGTIRDFPYRITRGDGSVRWVAEDASVVRSPDGTMHCDGCLQDITDRRAAEQSLVSLKKAVETLPLGVTITDTGGIITYANPAATRMHGYKEDELMGRSVAELVVPGPRRTPVDLVRSRMWKRERAALRKDGTSFPVQLISDTVRSPTGGMVAIVTSCEDITERKQSEDQLVRRAMHDELTGLANRALFRERLASASRASQRRDGPRFAVIFIDLDGFKHVNDSMGHAAGDDVLRQAAQRLTTELRPGDMVARFGGDEFAVLVLNVVTPQDAMLVAERCRARFAYAFEADGRDVFLGASIGVAVSDAGYDVPDELLRDADTAMYRAKSNGRMRCELFEPAMREDAIQRIGTDAELRRAVQLGLFEVYYQPIVRAGTWTVHSVEALCRWRHPERGLLPAEAFVPLAEETGLILSIDAIVLAQACRQVAESNRLGRSLGLNVNVSAHGFHRRDIVDLVRQALEDSGLRPDRLRLELTETAVVADVEASVRILTELREIGVGVSLDDFGTGHASLAALHRLPVDGVKIDRALIAEVPDGDAGNAIVRAILSLGKTLDLTITAEGVEHAAQATWLERAGCDLIQGYWSGGPSPTLPEAAHTGPVIGARGGESPEA